MCLEGSDSLGLVHAGLNGLSISLIRTSYCSGKIDAIPLMILYWLGRKICNMGPGIWMQKQ